jgi:small subunit ribosomal protein S20
MVVSLSARKGGLSSAPILSPSPAANNRQTARGHDTAEAQVPLPSAGEASRLLFSTHGDGVRLEHAPPTGREVAMPHTKSAKKRLRQNIKRRQHNRSVKRTLKTYIKRVEDAAEQKDLEKLQTEFRTAVRKLDQAAARRIVHPNLAARKKSQLARLVHAAGAQA